MLDQLNGQDIFTLVEHNHLRTQAMDLYERCLTEGTPDYLIRFVESQLIGKPPPLGLLYGLTEDLHQCWVTLHEHLFDIRNQLLHTLWSNYQVDLNTLGIVHSLDEYHLIDPDQLMASIAHHYASLSKQDLIHIRKEITTSLTVGYQIYGDTVMTTQMMRFVQDWAEGLGIDQVRHSWADSPEQDFSSPVH
jgi:hypothetical protein